MDVPVDLDAIRVKYTTFREAQRALNKKLVTMLPKQAPKESAQKLGLWRYWGIEVDHEDDLGVLTDYALYDFRLRGGTNAVERLWKLQLLKEGTPEHSVAAAMQSARFTVLRLVDLVPGVGAIVDDVLYQSRHLLADVGLSETGEPGGAIGARVLAFPEFLMTTGAAFALSLEPIERIMAMIHDESGRGAPRIQDFTVKDRSWLASIIMRGVITPDADEEEDDSWSSEQR